MMNYSNDVNVPANEVIGWEGPSVDIGPSLGPLMSFYWSYILWVMNLKVFLMKEFELPLQNKAASMQGLK